MKKLLLFIGLVFLLSCEKDNTPCRVCNTFTIGPAMFQVKSIIDCTGEIKEGHYDTVDSFGNKITIIVDCDRM